MRRQKSSASQVFTNHNHGDGSHNPMIEDDCVPFSWWVGSVMDWNVSRTELG